MSRMREKKSSQNYQPESNTITSWFRNTPHRWTPAYLPLAYAAACVEVVSTKSEKARPIFEQIIESWGSSELQALSKEVFADVSDSEKEKIKQGFLHPETKFLPDPDKPFTQLEEMLTGMMGTEDSLYPDTNAKELSPGGQLGIEHVKRMQSLVSEFIIMGFNREADIIKGQYRVTLSETAPWLMVATMIFTYFQHHNITLENIRNFYKRRRYKEDIIDFHKVLAEQPMSRLHRRMVVSGKALKLKLKNDRIFVEAARYWYQCRVVYPSINKYCDAPEKYHLDPKNISKQIRPCDEAVGYIRRIPKRGT